MSKASNWDGVSQETAVILPIALIPTQLGSQSPWLSKTAGLQELCCCDGRRESWHQPKTVCKSQLQPLRWTKQNPSTSFIFPHNSKQLRKNSNSDRKGLKTSQKTPKISISQEDFWQHSCLLCYHWTAQKLLFQSYLLVHLVYPYRKYSISLYCKWVISWDKSWGKVIQAWGRCSTSCFCYPSLMNLCPFSWFATYCGCITNTALGVLVKKRPVLYLLRTKIV